MTTTKYLTMHVHVLHVKDISVFPVSDSYESRGGHFALRQACVSHQPARPPGVITLFLSPWSGDATLQTTVQGSDCRSREAALQLLLLKCQP